MRKVTFGGASSLDNYFARKDHGMDWLMWSDEAGEIMGEFWKNVDTVVMGRKTYEIGLKMTEGKENPYGETKCYVFSRTLRPGVAKGGAAIVATDAVAFVRKLKRQAGKDICVMGGGELAHSLLEGGVLDEIGFNIHPILLGSGVPLFHEMKRDIKLELLDCRRFKNGCVYVLYRVKRARAKRAAK
ncbi:MAG TPA: dihydrofolate reductase family protein [Chthoniobacterales bacterium]|jgi:dihydrofolate reductase|nr:dihydrofolate reductase family protein [Chthoniobacterales bacterium]